MGEQLKKKLKKWIIHPIKRRIAKYYLILLRKPFGLKVIGITGSCGKTTTKELLASILTQAGKTVYSYANIDPVYNIPTTILKCRPGTKYLVLEMGVEYPGEMDFYLWLATPDLGVITNIYPTHTLFFGDINGVYAEKSKLVKEKKPEFIAVLNQNDPMLLSLGQKLNNKVVWFGNRVQMVGLKLDPLLNRDNVSAAIAVAKALGVKDQNIRNGINRFQPVDHRMKVTYHPSGAVIIDDSYNNNPAAAQQALVKFAKYAGRRRKVVVFGDMLELGKLEREEHDRIAKQINQVRPEKVILIGNAVKKMKVNLATFFSRWDEAQLALKNELHPQTVLLIKGSRSVGLDKLLKSVLQ